MRASSKLTIWRRYPPHSYYSWSFFPSRCILNPRRQRGRYNVPTNGNACSCGGGGDQGWSLNQPNLWLIRKLSGGAADVKVETIATVWWNVYFLVTSIMGSGIVHLNKIRWLSPPLFKTYTLHTYTTTILYLSHKHSNVVSFGLVTIDYIKMSKIDTDPTPGQEMAQFTQMTIMGTLFETTERFVVHQLPCTS